MEYNAKTNQHHVSYIPTCFINHFHAVFQRLNLVKQMQVKYKDGDEENLTLSNERIKFYISGEEMQSLNLSCSRNNVDSDVYDYNEMVVLAASLDDCQEVEPGDIIWAKITGLCFVYHIFTSMIHRGLVMN